MGATNHLLPYPSINTNSQVMIKYDLAHLAPGCLAFRQFRDGGMLYAGWGFDRRDVARVALHGVKTIQKLM